MDVPRQHRLHQLAAVSPDILLFVHRGHLLLDQFERRLCRRISSYYTLNADASQNKNYRKHHAGRRGDHPQGAGGGVPRARPADYGWSLCPCGFRSIRALRCSTASSPLRARLLPDFPVHAAWRSRAVHDIRFSLGRAERDSDFDDARNVLWPEFSERRGGNVGPQPHSARDQHRHRAAFDRAGLQPQDVPG